MPQTPLEYPQHVHEMGSPRGEDTQGLRDQGREGLLTKYVLLNSLHLEHENALSMHTNQVTNMEIVR